MQRLYPYAEWGLLTVAAPLLLFPTVRPMATLVALVVLALFWLASALTRRPWPGTPFNSALLLFGVASGVGVLVTAWPDLTLSKATGLLLGLALFRALASLRGPAALRWGGCVLAALVGAISAGGLLGAAFTSKIPLLGGAIARLPARLLALPEGPEGGINPNQLAGALAFALPLAFALVWYAMLRIGPRARRAAASKLRLILALVFDLALLLLALAGTLAVAGLLALTQSRSGWIGGVGGVAALVWLSLLRAPQRWLRGAALAAIALILISGVVIGMQSSPELWERLWGDGVALETEVAGRISLSGRVEIWSRALYAIQDFPFTGCGLGAFRRVVPLLYPLFTVSPDTDIAHAHNIFLQTATDIGLPGLIAYLGLLGLAAVTAWQVQPRHGLPLFAALLALHTYGLTDALALGSKPGIIFWAALGLLTALQANHRSREAAPIEVGVDETQK